MVSNQFIELIRRPEGIQKKHILELDQLCSAYPFCASIHKIRLKALKRADSIRYNKELKLTAALSANRSLLFKYITQKPIQSSYKEDSETRSEQDKNPLEVLKLGKPIDFNTAETHSFGEWLKLTKLKPINRENEARIIASLKPIEKTMKIVDFISNSVKKEKPKKEFFSPSAMAKESIQENTTMMTETLAKVYLEQGHYDKAITAFEILSLKYPQKSGLFADQIKAIKQINL
ncbi:MAG: hypothetical protein QNK65_04460 [Flavobacteriales bacterium]